MRGGLLIILLRLLLGGSQCYKAARIGLFAANIVRVLLFLEKIEHLLGFRKTAIVDQLTRELTISILIVREEATLQFHTKSLHVAAHLLQKINGLFAVVDRERWILLLVQHQTVAKSGFDQRVVDLHGDSEALGKVFDGLLLVSENAVDLSKVVQCHGLAIPVARLAKNGKSLVEGIERVVSSAKFCVGLTDVEEQLALGGAVADCARHRQCLVEMLKGLVEVPGHGVNFTDIGERQGLMVAVADGVRDG